MRAGGHIPRFSIPATKWNFGLGSKYLPIIGVTAVGFQQRLYLEQGLNML
jgi:hypothetical protein